MAKLKVFAAQMGFFETVVAVPSKKAALDAWGAHQDLFATGMAAKAADGAACEAALAQPGVVLRRAVGSQAAYSADGGVAGLKLPEVKPAKKAKEDKAAAPPRKASKPPSRKALSAAEAALSEGRARYDRERDAIEARRRDLETEADALRAAFDADRTRLEKARAKAADAYRKAGGQSE